MFLWSLEHGQEPYKGNPILVKKIIKKVVKINYVPK